MFVQRFICAQGELFLWRMHFKPVLLQTIFSRAELRNFTRNCVALDCYKCLSHQSDL